MTESENQQTQPNMFVVSLGGSLIVPSEIDIDFINRFKTLINLLVQEGNRFILVTGGGMITRKYQSAASRASQLTNEDSDWLGIHCTRLNAHFMRTIFKDIAHPRIYSDPHEMIPNDITEPLVFGAGFRPGWSTDYVAVTLANKMNVQKIANLSNIDSVYDKDPKKYSDAKAYEQITWQEYRNLIPKTWTPGLNSPFDPIASKLADETNIEVAVMNGNNLDNFKNYVNGIKFSGTIIKN